MILPGGLGHLDGARPLSGGSIARATAGRLGDGRLVVVKHTPYDAGLEAEGLEALGDAGAPVPGVLAVSADTLVLEHVSGPSDWHGLGAAVARTHRTTAERFGWHRDNVIGPLPQRNGWMARWGEFYLERRIRPYLASLPDTVRGRMERSEAALMGVVDRHASPSLIHGDLWSGNVVDGRWLIDPAVCFADRELDLAFLDLFGGVPASFRHGYDEEWPLDDGWERRRPALQLYHLLVHVDLFGAGYVPSVVERLQALGW